MQEAAIHDVEADAMAPNTTELSPLLGLSPSEANLEIAKRDTKEGYFVVVKEEVSRMASSSILTTLALVLEESFLYVNVMAVSHLGANELAAMALAATLEEVIYMAPSFGLMSAMETFCSTAFTASKDKTMVGFHLQRGIVAVVVFFIIISPVMWHTEWILLAIGQEPIIAQLSGSFIRIQIIGSIPFALFEAFRRYLQAQGIMHAGTIVAGVVAPIHWVSTFFFVRSPTYGLGFMGASIVTAATNWLLLIGILAYMSFDKTNQCWGGWDIRVMRNMGEFYRLAIPAVATYLSEWIGFELLTISASYFGAEKLAGQAIILNSVELLFQCSVGLGCSLGPRIGNLIGEGKPRQARITRDMGIAASLLIVSFGILFLTLGNSWWVSFYTTDPVIIREATKLIPVACVYIISDGLNGVLGALMRGLGRQELNAHIYLCAFYLCGLPMGLYLGFWKHMEAAGLWWGMWIGFTASSVFQLVFLYRWVDWKDEVTRCLARLRNSQEYAVIDEPVTPIG